MADEVADVDTAPEVEGAGGREAPPNTALASRDVAEDRTTGGGDSDSGGATSIRA